MSIDPDGQQEQARMANESEEEAHERKEVRRSIVLHRVVPVIIFATYLVPLCVTLTRSASNNFDPLDLIRLLAFVATLLAVLGAAARLVAHHLKSSWIDWFGKTVGLHSAITAAVAAFVFLLADFSGSDDQRQRSSEVVCATACDEDSSRGLTGALEIEDLWQSLRQQVSDLFGGLSADGEQPTGGSSLDRSDEARVG